MPRSAPGCTGALRADAAGDRIDPRPESLRAVDLVKQTVCTDEGLLGRVLGLGQGALPAQRQHDRGEAVKDPGEGVVVTGLGGPEIGGFVEFHCGHGRRGSGVSRALGFS